MILLRPLISILIFCPIGGLAIAQPSVLSRKQIPILCYHQIRDWKPKDSKADKQYIIPPIAFRAQMQLLADSGYHAILPDELYDYLVYGKPLPSKPVMLTFDDTNEDQYKVARPELLKYGFKGVYFIITAKIGTHKWFMDAKQIRQLSDEGNVIGCHTRNHTYFKKLKDDAWQTQIGGAKKALEEITGKPVDYFAFPYGYWNVRGLPELYKFGFKAAFQLDQPDDPKYPLMTIRRIIASGYWNAQTLDHHIKHDFGH